jgi:rsbT co-antagonist protein RsbR
MNNHALFISNLLQQHRPEIYAQWMIDVRRIWTHQAHAVIGDVDVRYQPDAILTELSHVFSMYNGDAAMDIGGHGSLAEVARELSSDLAQKGVKTQDITYYVIALKNVLTQQLVLNLTESSAQVIDCLRVIDDVLDRLSLLTFEAFVEARERVIVQQSLSLLELSTPVILLWNNVLLLPLVGVIDTVRARHFTERLLEFIAKHEAAVTIVDVTGVPVFDTSVARHIMKAIDAANLLGSRIVMTGISPEGAQTLTKLGINFSNVISRATLRAGVAEALNLVGRRIEMISGGRK